MAQPTGRDSEEDFIGQWWGEGEGLEEERGVEGGVDETFGGGRHAAVERYRLEREREAESGEKEGASGRQLQKGLAVGI
jgi:hypothetical protein